MKTLTLLAMVALFSQITSCQSPTSRAQTQRPRFSQTQIDSFRNLSGQVIPKSLWDKISEDSLPPQAVNFLTGNLDEDPADEVVLWYAWETTGQAICLDKRGEVWENIGKIDLDFFRGNNPPSINSRGKMLLTYSYGSGSGYESEVLNFYQNQHDSLVCVLSMLESEYLYMLGSGAERIISAQYVFKSPSLILTTFRYQVMAGEESEHTGKMIFEKNLTIPFHWDDSKNCFLPKLPEGFPQDGNPGFIDEGESTFDPFFEKELEEIKQSGPRWKRRALGNPK